MRKKPQITLFVPASLRRDEREWLAQLPELQLLGMLVVETIDWENEVTGTQNEWRMIAEEITTKSGESDGFLIWAPEQSLLSLAGYLKLSFDNLPLPIILFAAPSPKELNAKDLLKLGLQALLINGVYLAKSDIAEVLVLHGSTIFRPDQCYWELKEGSKVIVSKMPPFATIHFKLEIHQPYNQRSNKKLSLRKSRDFTKNYQSLQWYPGLSLGHINFSKEDYTFIQTMEAYWGAQEIQEMREQLLEKRIPIIWYSSDSWLQESSTNQEFFLSHPQEWWAVFMTQFAFSSQESSEEAFTLIRKKML